MFLSLIEFVSSWRSQSRQNIYRFLIASFLLFFALLLLFYPYMQVAKIYGAKRVWADIAPMLPRPQSYILSDGSYFWSKPMSTLFAGLPMRHEHQMFIGAVPMALALTGIAVGFSGTLRRDRTFCLIVSANISMIIITLYIGGFSLWYIFYKLPLASAIRAMTRIDQVVLFPVGYLAMIAVDRLRLVGRFIYMGAALLLLSVLLLEMSSTQMYVSLKQVWRDRLALRDKQVPINLSKKSVLFFSQGTGPFFAEELDSMWVSVLHGAKTMNGYSGLAPPNYTSQFSDDCAELPRRILSYLSFVGRIDDAVFYRTLMSSVVPLGFTNCDPQWFQTMPSFTASKRIYTAAEIKNVSYAFESREDRHSRVIANIILRNSGQAAISAQSMIGNPIRLGWRFIRPDGVAVSGWNERKDLPFDIPAAGQLRVAIPIDPRSEVKGGKLEISLVQEGVFWAFDIGLPPLIISWN